MLVFLLGFAFFNLEAVQSIRGDFAGWFLLLLVAIYFIWGIKWASRAKRMAQDSSSVVVPGNASFSRCTPALFLFFILGPCETLIPLMTYGGGDVGLLSTVLVISDFCGTTILTMLFCVMFFYYGISRFSLFMKFENYMHAATGLIIFLCGSAIQFLGA